MNAKRTSAVMVWFVAAALLLILPAAARGQDAYPPQPTPTPANFGPTAYPIATEDPFLQNLDAAGASPAVVLPEQVPPAPPPNTDNGLLFLWTGFIAAVLVFATSVVGSLLLFSRRNGA